MALAAQASVGRRQRIAQRRKALEIEAEQQRTAFLSQIKSFNAGRALAVAAGVGSIALLWSRFHR